LEAVQKAGKLAQVLDSFNEMWLLKEPYRLDREKTYTFMEILDRQLKNFFGAERGLEWFKENGTLTWPKKVEEVYWMQFLNPAPRTSIYWDILLRIGRDGEAVSSREGIDWDWSDYQPIPDYKECPGPSSPEFDMTVIFRRHAYQAGGSTWTDELPWVHELSSKSWSDRKVMINRDTAKQKGISDGDEVWVESSRGKTRGKAVLTYGIRRDVVELGQGFGAWSKGTPIRSESPAPAIAEVALAEAGMPEHWLEYHETSTTTPCAHTWVKVYKAKED
jgi:anaerobic selenocysteine-containing dehydrogenase